MALLLITADFPPITGGQARHIYNLWANISSRKVLVLAPCAKDTQRIDKAFKGEIIRKSIPLGENWQSRLQRPFVLLVHTLKIIRQRNIKSIHCWQLLSGGFVGYCIKFLCNIPYCLYVNGADLFEFQHRFPWAVMIKKFIEQANMVFVNSHYTKNLVQGQGIKSEKINILYPAINIKRYRHFGHSTDLKKKLKLNGKKIIATVGRLVERKGHDMVIQSLPQIIQEVPDVHYLIVGEGPYKEKLQGLVKRLDLDRHVTFAGFVPEAKLPAYYALCQIFIMVSREIPHKGDVEGFGIVYLEANALGKPVIAGRAGGVEDAVIHGRNGLLVDPCSIDMIKGAVLKMLHDENLRNSLGTKGQKRVIKDFDWKQRAKQFEEIISPGRARSHINAPVGRLGIRSFQ